MGAVGGFRGLGRWGSGLRGFGVWGFARVQM